MVPNPPRMLKLLVQNGSGYPSLDNLLVRVWCQEKEQRARWLRGVYSIIIIILCHCFIVMTVFVFLCRELCLRFCNPVWYGLGFSGYSWVIAYGIEVGSYCADLPFILILGTYFDTLWLNSFRFSFLHYFDRYANHICSLCICIFVVVLH